ncbi:uncharacterized protein LOC115752579 [Rhodamnia argentea]|uniref:Uncharacterized protein LOC115752579 n=1 Tax=Rhodamnia argentea TaxID=178133 RepID=A0A8B8QHT2_9MYRT|nr:uncharacterized protein LOC115752579 [Rhodamnia argentea]
MASYPSPIQEHGREGEDGFDYYVDDVSPSGCSWFCLKWWRGGRGDRAHPYMRHCDGNGDESWVMSKFKKVREFTEVAAGPKWKNFIRKVGGYCHWRSDKKRNNNSRFGYDAESYALNFDGAGNREEEDVLLMKGFSARFASSFKKENEQEGQPGIGLS